MTGTDRVRIDYDGHIAVVSMTRADKRNGLDFPMMDALRGAAAQLASRREIRVVILRGEGQAFCAGLDFAATSKQPAKMMLGFVRLPWRSTNHFQDVAWAWRQLPMPVIAVLHGAVFGGGIQLALAADFRIAAPDAQLSVMEARWGLVPDMTGTVTLSELVGIDVAKRLTMTGEIIDGTRAHELGLVTEVADDPDASARELAEQLALRSPDAVAAGKKLLNSARHRSLHRQFVIERHLQLRLLRGANHRIARTAGMAKEIPQFIDRTFRP